MAVSTWKTTTNLKEFLLHTWYVKPFLISRNTIIKSYLSSLPLQETDRKALSEGFWVHPRTCGEIEQLAPSSHAHRTPCAKQGKFRFKFQTLQHIYQWIVALYVIVFTQQDFCNKLLQLSSHSSKKIFKTYYAKAELWKHCFKLCLLSMLGLKAKRQCFVNTMCFGTITYSSVRTKDTAF